ncbi:major facilitator superfamily MFS_1 [Acidithiobacillus ferrivorans SS3]|uniref:Major facilitator superfamily MFS_1 n=1 Tax=Acidithiobacillus ferrivorans SS3 TaxID=743299 RepID=G0JTF6_9PROT|nr:MFS transporter [Acidithiobacillus ferrivorans]AEM47807.1 major facilitator superfamily MFS_1 [Acidithiobacillus ferrivorans SS3]OFA16598.1 MFS transporter [Acidithiobacillus ferrivorans]
MADTRNPGTIMGDKAIAARIQETRGHLDRWRAILKEPDRWVSVWFLAYALLGAVSSGLLPILLPLMIVALTNHLSWVAYVMGGFNLGLLTSPLWGILADRKQLHRPIFFGGFLVLSLALAVMPFLPGIFTWSGLSLLAGAGTSAVATMASLFIVEFDPQNEWEPRLGWLQTFNGGGQVGGLLLAGIFVSNFKAGLICSALALIPAIWLGAKGLPTAAKHYGWAADVGDHMRHDLDWRFLANFGRPELLGGGLLRFSHHLSLRGARRLGDVLHTRFGRFLLSWFAVAFGVAAFFAYFPVAMQKAYSVAPALTSSVYAMAAAIALVLYSVGGQLSGRFGAGRVYRWSLMLRFLGFGLLLLVFFLPVPKTLTALAGFVLIVIAWPLQSISGTTLTARLTPVSQGAAMGLFNASGAVATVVGTFLGGPLVQFIGYPSLSAMALLGILIGWLMGHGLQAPSAAPAHPDDLTAQKTQQS